MLNDEVTSETLPKVELKQNEVALPPTTCETFQSWVSLTGDEAKVPL